MSPRTAALWCLASLAACAAAPEDRLPIDEFDDSAGRVEVAVLGDGFVLADGRRIPLEALVLELRHTTRRMTDAQLQRFVVYLRVAEAVGDATAAEVAQQNLNRLLDELDVMEIAQVKLSSAPQGRSAADSQ
ncbi:MAG: hypothetical protein H6835_14170 [Planctomycetes bacterium]|nr:hypothetical protein [Planctomycetota bacterium]